jgi:hypothetical protein
MTSMVVDVLINRQGYNTYYTCNLDLHLIASTVL